VVGRGQPGRSDQVGPAHISHTYLHIQAYSCSDQVGTTRNIETYSSSDQVGPAYIFRHIPAQHVGSANEDKNFFPVFSLPRGRNRGKTYASVASGPTYVRVGVGVGLAGSSPYFRSC
jgi:hypothetical protein